MRELVEGKNTIGRMAAVLKKPYKANFNLFNPPMKMEQTECSKTSAHKIQTP